MSKQIYAIALALVLGTTGALAGGYGSDQDQRQGQEQHQRQGQEQQATAIGVNKNANLNANVNSNEANAGAISGSSSDSNATSSSVGGGAVVGVAVKTGPTVSGSISNAEGGQGGDGGDARASASSYGGDSRAYSEGSDANSSVGDVTSRSGDSNSGGNVLGTSVNVGGDIFEYEAAAAQAANVYTQVCQNGGSAQGIKGGFGVTNSDVLCDHLKTAAFMREAYMFEMKYGTVQCQELMEGEKMEHMAAEYSDTCMNTKARYYYDAYHESMGDAISLMDNVEEAGMLDKFMGYLIRPAALIGALIWLI